MVTRIIIALLLGLAWYVTAAFVGGDFNPNNWDVVAKYFIACFYWISVVAVNISMSINGIKPVDCSKFV